MWVKVHTFAKSRSKYGDFEPHQHGHDMAVMALRRRAFHAKLVANWRSVFKMTEGFVDGLSADAKQAGWAYYETTLNMEQGAMKKKLDKLVVQFVTKAEQVCWEKTELWLTPERCTPVPSPMSATARRWQPCSLSPPARRQSCMLG